MEFWAYKYWGIIVKKVDLDFDICSTLVPTESVCSLTKGKNYVSLWDFIVPSGVPEGYADIELWLKDKANGNTESCFRVHLYIGN